MMDHLKCKRMNKQEKHKTPGTREQGPHCVFKLQGAAGRLLLLIYGHGELGLEDNKKTGVLFVGNGYVTPLQAVGVR